MNNNAEKQYELNKELAQMLKGGVIMDVTTPEQARIAAVAKWLKLIDVIQYIVFAFGLGLLTLLIGVVGLSLLGIRGIEEF